MDIDKVIGEVERMKAWIDNADYETLLRKWRFGASGDPFFQGDMGKYYSDRMFGLRDKLNEEQPGATVGASKNVGWEP